MSSDSYSINGMKLLVKYLSTKYTINGHLSKTELDFLKNTLAYNEELHSTVMHTFNHVKRPLKSKVKDPFLRGF